uniref:Uncharacterized protein n=1 Tax=Cucumis melo TaxID=3656 RepID=A0A9I9E9U4_CUCME
MEEVYSRIEREAETRLRKWGRNVSPNLGGDEIGLRKLGFLNIGPKRDFLHQFPPFYRNAAHSSPVYTIEAFFIAALSNRRRMKYIKEKEEGREKKWEGKKST